MMIKKLLSEIWPWWQWSSPGGDSGPDRFWRSLQASRGPEAGSACWWVWIFILTPFSALGTLADSSAGLPRSRRWWRRWRTFIPVIRVVVFLLKIEINDWFDSIPFQQNKSFLKRSRPSQPCHSTFSQRRNIFTSFHHRLRTLLASSPSSGEK